MAEELTLPDRGDGALLPVDLETQPALEEFGDRGHHPPARRLGTNVDVHVVGVAAKAVAPGLQHLVQVVEKEVGEQRRQRTALRRALETPDANALAHHPRFQEAANDPEQAFVANAPGQTGHQDIVVDPVEGPPDRLPTTTVVRARLSAQRSSVHVTPLKA
jgi:hypothetical protein